MERPSSPKGSFTSVTHAALFAPEPLRCDACGELLDEDATDDDAIAGKGLYLTARGDEVRREEVPLCASCSVAIGLASTGPRSPRRRTR